MTIAQLVEKYQSDRNHYRSNRYNETQLRSDFLDPLFELLGWDIKNTASKPTYEREVILEEGLKASADTHSKKPDYTFRLYSTRKFFLEAKKPSVEIQHSDATAIQVRRYGFTAKLKISVASNFEHLLIYDTSVPIQAGERYNVGLIRQYHYLEYVEKFPEILALLGKESVYNGQFDEQWQDIEEKIDAYSIDELFLSQINSWRLDLGREIFTYMPGIDITQLNDTVQSYLNGVLFLRVCEDRNLEEYKTLLVLAERGEVEALINKFRQADRTYNSRLFDQLLSDEILGNVGSVFWRIINQLYFPQSAYSFSVFSSDILGRIYEIFLSQKLGLISGVIELVDKPEHIDRDIVATPNFIISELLLSTVAEKCESKTTSEIFEMRFSDISCGSGAFLLELYQMLGDIMIDKYLVEEPSVLIQRGTNTFVLPYAIKQRLLLSCIYGVDKDFNAVEASKFGLLLKLLEGEDIASTVNSTPILPNLDQNIFYGNSLLSPDMFSGTASPDINPFDFGERRFDVILGNPPYMKSEDMKRITPAEYPFYKTNYTVAYKQFDKYFLFIQRALQLLNKDGVMGYIVPSKFTKVGAALKLRGLLDRGGHLRSLVSFGSNQVFTDKTTYTCLLKLGKEAQSTFCYGEVADLQDFKVRKQDAIDISIKTTAALQDECWVLYPDKLENAFQSILAQSTKLIELVTEDNIFNGIQTSANPEYVLNLNGEDEKYIYFLRENITWKVEKTLTRPYFKTSAGSDNLNTYRTFLPNARVIFPYQLALNGRLSLVSLTEMETNYPYMFAYLMEVKDKLTRSSRDIKPVPTNANEWHRFGRQQGLETGSKKEKIMVGVLSKGDKYAFDKQGTLFTSGGTAGYCAIAFPEQFNYSPYYIQAILNSKYVEWFAMLTGEIFRGGFYARGTKVLNNLPIRTIEFNDTDQRKLHDDIAIKQQQLIDIHDEIDLNVGNRRMLLPLEANFKREKNRMDQLLQDLYSLGSDDQIIPLINP